jgi:hypothetical protein
LTIVASPRGFPELRDQLLHVVRERRFEQHRLLIHWVGEAEAPGMERLAPEWNRPQRIGSVGIANLANKRVAAQTRLKPDLVALARMKADFDQPRRLERLNDLITADRLRRARVLRMCFLLDERLAVPDEIVVPRA